MKEDNDNLFVNYIYLSVLSKTNWFLYWQVLFNKKNSIIIIFFNKYV
jgi:hypothetical protein